MSLTKLSMLFLAAMLSVATLSSSVLANEGKACKADADCAHGEHCKEGHCHK